MKGNDNATTAPDWYIGWGIDIGGAGHGLGASSGPAGQSGLSLGSDDAVRLPAWLASDYLVSARGVFPLRGAAPGGLRARGRVGAAARGGGDADGDGHASKQRA